MNPQSCLVLALAVSLTVSAPPSSLPDIQVGKLSSGDSDKCPVKAADVEKLTSYRWKIAQYQADRVYIPSGSIRIDYCELIGSDGKGQIRMGVMVNIARGANAEAFAQHWHAACAGSLMPDARGKVQPVAGVPGGQQCVPANGSSSSYWIELPGRTIQIEPMTESADWAKILPQLLAAAAR